MTDPRDQDDEAEELAAEYVVGTLPLAKRLRAEALIRSDPGFAARVAAWEQHFAPLNEAYPDVPAPPDLLPRIEARLHGLAAPRRRFSLGRLFGGMGVAAALLLALFLALDPGPVPTAPTMTATLSGEAQPLVFAAAYDPAAEALTITRTTGPAPDPGSSYELWVIVGTATPVSLGLVDDASVVRTVGPLLPGSTLAVTLEPAGGSPDGVPGALLVSGTITSS